MNIDTLEAGREMDAIIHDKVLRVAWDDSCCRVCGWLISPQWVSCTSDSCSFRPVPTIRADDPPSYSVDIESAWHLVNTMQQRWFDDDPDEPFYWRIEAMVNGWRAAIVWDHHDDDWVCYSVTAETLPLAVCRVLMKAEVGKNE